MGTDRPTALVCGEPSILLAEVALGLADGGYDVHLPLACLAEQTRLVPAGSRLHPAADAERALLACVKDRARPLEVAVIQAGTESNELSRTVATYQRAVGRGRLVVIRPTQQAPRPAQVRRVVAAVLDGAPLTAGRCRAGHGFIDRWRARFARGWRAVLRREDPVLAVVVAAVDRPPGAVRRRHP